MKPRFLLVCGVIRDGFAHPAWPDVTSPLSGRSADNGTWLSWRLTGGNHRELGRSVSVFPSAVAVFGAIHRLREACESLQGIVAASPRDARWTWRVSLDGGLVAISSRAYARNRECLYNLETFLAALPDADVSEAIPHSRFTQPTEPPMPVQRDPDRPRATDAPIDTSGYAG